MSSVNGPAISIDGLVSGLDTTSIISQLSAVTRRQAQQIEIRQLENNARIEALNAVNSQLLNLQLSFDLLNGPSIYRSATATSSDEDLLTATASRSDVTGSFSITIARIAASSQLYAQGFPDQDSTQVGEQTLTLEMGGGFVDDETSVDTFNGQSGIDRGSIHITDKSGSETDINLSTAISAADIVNIINSTSGVQVQAEVYGDGFRLTDTSGGAGTFSVTEVSGGTTAASLGLLKSTAGTVLMGESINTISGTTRTAALNDGNGFRQLISGGDFDITDKNGTIHAISMSGVKTLQGAIDAINTTAGGDIVASIDSDGNNITLLDTTGGAGALSIAANSIVVQGNTIYSTAANDLGLLGVTAELNGVQNVAAGDTLVGRRLQGTINSPLLRSLNGGEDVIGAATIGSGVASGSIALTDRAGNTSTISLAERTQTTATGVITAGDTTINVGATTGFHIGNRIRVSDGTNTEYRVITAKTATTLTFDEGLSSGYAIGSGVTADVDSLNDVINAINNDGTVSLEARINDLGDGLEILDKNGGAPTSLMRILESGSTTAADLGILTGGITGNTVDSGTTTTIVDAALIGSNSEDLIGMEVEVTSGANSGQSQTVIGYDDTTGTMTFDGAFTGAFVAGDTYNILGVDRDQLTGQELNKQYLSGSMLLDNLNGGDGVFGGSFRVTDRNGISFTVDIENALDVDDVLTNMRGAGAGASSDMDFRINSRGNGIIMTSPTGSGTIQVTDLNGGTSALDLNLVGSGTGTTMDGGRDVTVTISSSDTLDDVRDALTDLDLNIQVSILNDGSAFNPYRLNVLSEEPGLAGRLRIRSSHLAADGLDFSQATKAQDAAIVFGSTSSGNPVVITNSSNVFDEVIPGVTLQAKGVSSQEIQVNIERDVDQISSAVSSMVEEYNNLFELMKELQEIVLEDEEDSFDEDDENISRGLLASNLTVRQLERALQRYTTQTLSGLPVAFNRLSSLGISINSAGDGIEFEESTLRDGLNSNFDEVRDLLLKGGNISGATLLSSLRGGEGVRRTDGGADFRVETRDGTRFTVEVSSANTISEVILAINSASGNTSVTARIADDGERLILEDSSTGTNNFVVTSIGSGSQAALDLGIQRTEDDITSTVATIKGTSLLKQGFAGLGAKLSRDYTDFDGRIIKNQESLQDLNDDLQLQIDRINDRAANEEARLRIQFSAMEQSLAELQSQSSFIAQALSTASLR